MRNVGHPGERDHLGGMNLRDQVFQRITLGGHSVHPLTTGRRQAFRAPLAHIYAPGWVVSIKTWGMGGQSLVDVHNEGILYVHNQDS